MNEPSPPEDGAREPGVCGWCHSPIWRVYHGPNRNQTHEPRLVPDEQAIERAAKYLFFGSEPERAKAWPALSAEVRQTFLDEARAVLAAAHSDTDSPSSGASSADRSTNAPVPPPT